MSLELGNYRSKQSICRERTALHRLRPLRGISVRVTLPSVRTVDALEFLGLGTTETKSPSSPDLGVVHLASLSTQGSKLGSVGALVMRRNVNYVRHGHNFLLPCDQVK